MAFLGAMAISFSIIESMVPRPLPWMRIGLANAITLYSFTVLRPREVLPVVLSRVVAASIMLGTLFSVSFFLSLSGALSSFVIMYLMYTYMRRVFTLVGVSVAGAVTSNVAQLTLLNLLFINNRISYFFLPFILLFALIGGVLSGLFARFLTENI
ncbi:MAG TPA: Gx transporter family protein [Spirochaetes bacterium]|nr:Gx transporter family protein [Spirochaetota bacterium]